MTINISRVGKIHNNGHNDIIVMDIGRTIHEYYYASLRRWHPIAIMDGRVDSIW